MQLTDQQQLFKKLARDFAQGELTDEVIEKLEETSQLPPGLRETMAKIGIFGIKTPRKYGGVGADTVSYTQVIQEIAYQHVGITLYFTMPNMLTGGGLLNYTNPAQKKKYLTPVAKGDMVIAFALTEPDAGSDAAAISTTAVEDGDYYVLNGHKTMITGAPYADIAITFAKTDPDARTHGITAFIVDMHAPGVLLGKPEKKMGITGCDTTDVILKNVRVPKEDMLGKLNKGFEIAMSTLDLGRLSVAAQSLGCARRAFDEALAYAKVRKSMGKPIAKHQGISFMLAEMATRLHALEVMVYDTAALKDAGINCNTEASMCKYYGAETCKWIVDRAVQIFGGYGYFKEYVVERLYRDARIFGIFEGTTEVQKIVISNDLIRNRH